MNIPTYTEILELIDATIHPDAIVTPDELTIGDWAQELETELRDTRLMEGNMPMERFEAGTALVYNLVPYAIATSSGSDDEWVDTSTTLVDLLTDFFGLSTDHTLVQLIEAIRGEAELEEDAS